MPESEEEALQGGNVSAGVVRVGATVHRPTGPWTPTVHALLRHLRTTGFDGAPQVLGFDAEGREVLEFIAGEVPWPANHHRLLGTDDAMWRVGQLLGSFHSAVADFKPGPQAVWRFPEMAPDAMAFVDGRGVIVCHNDPAAWNLVVSTGRWAFIDWDTAGPRPPIWDLAYCGMGMVPIAPDPTHAGWPEPPPVAQRLRALAEGYGLSRPERARLPEVIVARIRSSYEHGGRRAAAGVTPWADLWRNGHGQAWAAMLAFARAHAGEWSRQLRRR